jgi:GTP-binding protein HflX
VLVADTVGFIRDLPHDLVASFRSTLQEANEARLLLHLVDAADPDHARQIQVTREVLAEIGADRIPTLLCFNKNDKLDEPTREALRAAWPEAVFVSAYDPASVAALHGRIVSFFEQDAMEVELLVPHGARGIIGELRASTRVLDESWEQEGAVFRVRGTAAAIERLRGLGAR